MVANQAVVIRSMSAPYATEAFTLFLICVIQVIQGEKSRPCRRIDAAQYRSKSGRAPSRRLGGNSGCREKFAHRSLSP